MPKAENTRKTYHVGANQFEYWAASKYWRDKRFRGVRDYYRNELVEEFIRELMNGRKATWTIRTYLHGIKFMAKEYGVNPPIEISEDLLPQIKEKIPVWVTKEEVLIIIDSLAHDKQYRALIALLYDTAVRISEALALNVEDVSFKENTITLDRRKGSYVPYVIPFSDTTAFFLKEYMEEWGLKNGMPLFQGKKSERLHECVAIREIKMYGKIYLEKKITPHAFRHGRAIALRQAGTDITEIADLLGHKRLETTRRYARITGTHLKKLPKAF